VNTQIESTKLEFFRPDAFSFINALKTTPSEEKLINLSIGAPNRPTPEWILAALKNNLDDPRYHTYPPQHGSPELLAAIAYWYEKRYGVKVHPTENILITVGIKEAIFNSFHALINMGDCVLLADPGYPTYFEAAAFTGAKSIFYNSDAEEQSVLQEISDKVTIHKPKILVLNYPSNPTGRTASLKFYRDVSDICERSGTIVMSDIAYSEVSFDGFTTGSFLQARPAGNLTLEYFSFSKTYNMAGWRIGAIVGDKRIVDAVKLYKSKIDSNVFYPLQLAAVSAIRDTPDSYYRELKAMYQERRDALLVGLVKAGLKFTAPQGSFYVWVDLPESTHPWAFTELLYKKYGILGVPGTAYGNNGSKKIRLGLVQETAAMREASERIATLRI